MHSGGMVICDRPVIEVCPVEWATAPGRTVLQWDKDDCAAVGLVKFDLLGLGMLEALHRTVDLVADYHGTTISTSPTIPQDDAVYEMLCRGRHGGGLPGREPRPDGHAAAPQAQRLLRPRGRGRAHPARTDPGRLGPSLPAPAQRARRRSPTCTRCLKPCLEKTLGVPLFQEQLMQMAIDVAGFSAAEADQLRQAMGSKRSAERMEALRQRFYAGMAERQITGEVADEIFAKLAAFANFGFPESHAVSFAYLVYSSAWLKLHYPAAFFAGAAQLPADGVLVPADPRRRRPPPRGGGAPGRGQPQRGRGRPRTGRW